MSGTDEDSPSKKIMNLIVKCIFLNFLGMLGGGETIIVDVSSDSTHASVSDTEHVSGSDKDMFEGTPPGKINIFAKKLHPKMRAFVS